MGGVVLEVKTVVDTSQAKKANKEIQEGVKQTSKEADAASESIGNATNQLDKMTGGAVTAFRSIVNGAKSGVVAMTTLKGAIAATGIGALLLAVGSLVLFFTRTQRGADLLNQAFAVIGTTVDVLIDRFSSFGEGVIQLFSGDLSQALDTFKDAISGIGEEIIEESKASLQLEKDLQNLRDREIDFIKVQAEKRRAIEQARLAAEEEQRSNETKAQSDERRANALRESIRIQNELTNEQIEIETERARIIRERVALGESLASDLEDQARAEARVIELETERDRRLRSINTRLNAFIGNEKKLTEAQLERIKVEKKLRDIESISDLETLEPQGAGGLTPEQELELQQNEFLNQKLLQQNEAFEKENQAISIRLRKKTLVEQERQEKANAIARIQLQQSVFAITQALADQGFADVKAIQIAQAVISTFQGVNAALAQTTDFTPSQTLRFANAAAVGIAGALNVRKILSTGKGSSNATPSSISAPRGDSSFSPTDGNNIPDFGFINQGIGGNQAAGLNRQPIILQDIRNAEILEGIIKDKERIA